MCRNFFGFLPDENWFEIWPLRWTHSLYHSFAARVHKSLALEQTNHPTREKLSQVNSIRKQILQILDLRNITINRLKIEFDWMISVITSSTQLCNPSLQKLTWCHIGNFCQGQVSVAIITLNSYQLILNGKWKSNFGNISVSLCHYLLTEIQIVSIYLISFQLF